MKELECSYGDFAFFALQIASHILHGKSRTFTAKKKDWVIFASKRH